MVHPVVGLLVGLVGLSTAHFVPLLLLFRQLMSSLLYNLRWVYTCISHTAVPCTIHLSQVRVNSPSPSTSLRSGCCCVSKGTCMCLKVFLGVFTSVCLDAITTTFNNPHIATRLLRLPVDRPATLLLAEEVHLPSLGHTHSAATRPCDILSRELRFGVWNSG